MMIENLPSKRKGGLRTLGRTKVSTLNSPLISIITIVFNGNKYLSQTIDSVVGQGYPNIEYIIIDGGSTDGTLEILNERSDEIDFWISEPDKGISDAFNKGIKLANGKLIGLINSDDWYEQDIISSIVENQKVKTMIDLPLIIYGKTYRIKEDGIKIEKTNSKLGWAVSVPFSHCSSFATKKYYDTFGVFDIGYKVAMDVDVLMRGLKSANYLELPVFIGNQRDGGISEKNRLLGYKEYYNISKRKIGVNRSLIGYFYKMIVFYMKRITN